MSASFLDIYFLNANVPASLQGLVLGVFDKEGEEGSLHLTKAAEGFDQTVSGKLSELLKMLV